MGKFVESFLDGFDSFFAWMSASLKQSVDNYCALETADSETVLAAHDGSLMTVIEVEGVRQLVGTDEFENIISGLANSLQSALGRDGHSLQVFFGHDKQNITSEIRRVYGPAKATKDRLGLALNDLFTERENHLAKYCASERVFFVLWTHPETLTGEQLKQASKDKIDFLKEKQLPPFRYSQAIFAGIPELREEHSAFVRSLVQDFGVLNIDVNVLDVHQAVYEMRLIVDPDFTDEHWRPVLPGDEIKVKEINRFNGDASDLLWPCLSKQILPRDAENLDLRAVRVGDKVYSTIYIDLFPKDIRPFMMLFSRVLPSHIPWRISFLMQSDGMSIIKFKGLMTSILAFSSAQNRLISDANNLLKYIKLNTDDAIIKLRVAASTWADDGEISLLRRRTSELAKAIEGWGSCDVSEISGDPFGGIVSTMMGVSADSQAVATVAPLTEVVRMLPVTRPASTWKQGALLFRSTDGKLWPFQPGSSAQTTWIDLVYARPGSGKSVLSNATNLALCLSAGLVRLPRIAIIDIGPSSSGLISLLKEALPDNKKHQVAYYRLRMTPEYAINPLDTQLGCRFPTPQERSFLVNFLTLLATPHGSPKPYDGVPDLAGMVIDELYKNYADNANAYAYSPGMEPAIDSMLEEIGFVEDSKTTWWEVTDALFLAGLEHQAILAQRYAMPLIADAASICRIPAIDDLYGKITTPTGEPLLAAFSRMISAAVREYPILSKVTSFDIGEAKVVSLDLDEVAKSGGDSADRQTAVMYMLARYVLARHYYLTKENVKDMPEQYRDYHSKRVQEIREDPKRIVYDEFHRTSKATAVRDQVLIDMREGRKWGVQISLLSQAVEDFDKVMIDFATAIYVMDAGPKQAIDKTSEIFGLSPTAKLALKRYVHGPSADGATFLVQYATKKGVNVQLLTLTLGPIELWAFSTTAEDAEVRNHLYHKIGPAEARRVLANLFPGGSVTKELNERLNRLRTEDDDGLISDDEQKSMLVQLTNEILDAYAKNPDVKFLTSAV